MRIKRLVCSTSRKPSSRHSADISLGCSRSDQRPLDGRIERGGNVPQDACVQHAAVSILHSSSHGTSGAHDPTLLGYCVGRIGDELQYEHGEGAIEGIIFERQGTGIRLLEADPRVHKRWKVPRNSSNRPLPTVSQIPREIGSLPSGSGKSQGSSAPYASASAQRNIGKGTSAMRCIQTIGGRDLPPRL